MVTESIKVQYMWPIAMEPLCLYLLGTTLILIVLIKPSGTREHDDIVAEDDVIMRSCSGTNASYNKMQMKFPTFTYEVNKSVLVTEKLTM